MAKPHYPALLFPHRWGEGGWLCLGGPLPTIVWLSVHLWLVQYYRLQWRVPRANKSCHFPFGESDALKRRKTSETRDSGPRITGKFPCSHLVAGSTVRRSFIFFATSSLKPAFYIDNFLASGWGCLKKRGGIFQTVPDRELYCCNRFSSPLILAWHSKEPVSTECVTSWGSDQEFIGPFVRSLLVSSSGQGIRVSQPYPYVWL